jgi:hypothetical protein
MKRYLFAVLASLMVLVALPAASGARSHHERTHHARHHRAHRARHVRIEHFRSADRGPSGTSSNPTTNPASEDAGTVQGFDSNHVLTLSLNNGSLVSGTVGPNTRIECRAMDEQFTRDDGGPGSGDQSGDQSGQQGDNGDRGDNNDNGDDNGEDNGEANDNQACQMALQTPGTHVRDATLSVTSAGATWTLVELDS